MSKKTLIIVSFLVFIAVLVAVVLSMQKRDRDLEKERTRNLKKIQETEIDREKNQDKQEIDTSNWQTYRNEEFGFEIKYPEDWIHVEFYYSNENVGNGLKIIPKSCWEDDQTGYYCDIHVGFSVYKKLEGASLFKGNPEEIRRSRNSSDVCREDVELPSLRISNESIDLKKCYSNSLGYNWNIYYFVENNIGYELILMHMDPLHEPVIERKILETFKLIKNND